MIEPAELIGDPLYQCNLLLWMLQPSTGATVAPLLRNAGYTLRHIEPKLPLTLPLSSKLKTDGLAAAEDAEPDLVIRNSQQDYVIIECKRSMFGYQPGNNDTHIRQCRAFLLQVPQIFAEASGAPPAEISSTHLLYLSRHNTQVPQFTGVQAIASDLTAREYKTTPASLLTLDVSASSIGLRKTETHGQLPGPLVSLLPNAFTALQTIPDADTDPRPLYYLPWMPDSEPAPDPYNYNSFANRILLWATTIIAPATPPCDVELDTEALLDKATNGFSQFWRNAATKSHIRSRAKDLLRKEITKADSKAAIKPLDKQRPGLQITLADAKMQSRIVEQFRKWQSEVWLTPPVLTTAELFPNEVT